MMILRRLLPSIGCVLGLLVALQAEARTLRLFVIGNSFSNNATRHLPALAQAGGHTLVLAHAQTGGCSFERHWVALEAHLANPADPKGRIYGGKSLPEHMGTGPWDVITVQQYSLLSPHPATYQPFADKLHAYLRKVQPAAEIVVHQTWAYRRDAPRFGRTGPRESASGPQEMWEKSRAAYRDLAARFGARILPVGDAFWEVDSDPQWGFKPDPRFDAKAAVYPALPDQTHSLHVGYRWNEERKLGLDANHANTAGEYLGALVWYGVLFEESPEPLAFVPAGLDPAFAAHLRRVAARVVRAAAAERRAAAIPAGR
jgi:hypothetical protein